MAVCPMKSHQDGGSSRRPSASSNAMTLSFSLFAYGAFFATFLYLVGFVANLPFLPLTVDKGAESPAAVATLVDLFLIAAFGLQHSSMARAPFKRWITARIPEAVERSVYVLSASAVLVALFLFWRPIEGTLWSVGGPVAIGLWALAAIGWATVLLSTFLINHFELFGLQQAWFHFRGRKAQPAVFRQPLFYKLVRHPLYLGFLMAFWATPVMSVGHALFAAGMTAYVLLAIRLEERDLVAHFGEAYERYRREVGMLLPKIG